jgi:hypothetical protein
MTLEQTAELVNAFNDGITARHVSPALTLLRTAWLQADASEREIFKRGDSITGGGIIERVAGVAPPDVGRC